MEDYDSLNAPNPDWGLAYLNNGLMLSYLYGGPPTQPTSDMRVPLVTFVTR